MNKPSAGSPSDARPSRSAIPSVGVLLEEPEIRDLSVRYGRSLVADLVRQVQDELRTTVSCDPAAMSSLLAKEAIVERLRILVEQRLAPSLRRVFNLSGTILHTNLGRALLPEEAIDAMVAVARAPSNLEYDLEEGGRGDRDDHLEPWLTRLTGAEAATVVNNNAAAVLLVLNTFALGKQVLVSRGELIEIGGSFRLPDIMARAGCELVEVGTTNRTHLKDYEGQINERTRLLMRAHTSNYHIEGFVKAVPDRELAALSKSHGLPFVIDLGSGTLVDLEQFGLPREPTPAVALADGADLVTFSGDKLLGGPQAGVIVGRKGLIAKIKQNPMKRAMRLDKITIAALEAVLRLYSNPDDLARRLPTIRLMSRPLEEIRLCAERCAPVVQNAVGNAFDVGIIQCESQAGSGSLPSERLPSIALAIRPVGAKKDLALRVQQLSHKFRRLPTPVIGRIQNNALILDLRCLNDEAGFCAQIGGVSAIL